MKDYKRLTERNENGEAIINMQGVTNEQEARKRIHEFSKLIINKLCVYEEKEESGELCDRKEIIMVKGKVIDEPNEWAYGQLLPNNRIFQKEKHSESKNCGIGVFEVIPETIKPIEMCDREEVRKETAREILDKVYKAVESARLNSEYQDKKRKWVIDEYEFMSEFTLGDLHNLYKEYGIDMFGTEQVGNSDKLEEQE